MIIVIRRVDAFFLIFSSGFVCLDGLLGQFIEFSTLGVFLDLSIPLVCVIFGKLIAKSGEFGRSEFFNIAFKFLNGRHRKIPPKRLYHNQA